MMTASRLLDSRGLKKPILMAILILIIGIGLGPNSAWAQAKQVKQDKNWDIGIQTGSLFEIEDAPIDNMPMISCHVSRRLNDTLSAILALDSYVFDIENTGRLLGIPTVGESHSSGRTSIATASIDYMFLHGPYGLQPYVRAGVGIGFTNFDNDNNVYDKNGTHYDIKAEIGDDVEVMPTISAGIRYITQSRWFFDAGARFDYHISNWKIKDSVSGRETHINNFSAIGAYIGFGAKL